MEILFCEKRMSASGVLSGFTVSCQDALNLPGFLQYSVQATKQNLSAGWSSRLKMGF